ncbi:SOUL family heme-binding protein [Leucothrix arctica]|uniref:Heme-binding protein n=1 Tax=Leucothrix arctica TaxID=1481894 RepID=A0A317C4I4_9GAMM|nr:heme-binding protein [Leucothrix arctica]PWQ93555.1 heme-binding protein [Leucothrix arctica]
MTHVKQFLLAMLIVTIGASKAMATEEAMYRTVLKDKGFEVRLYEPHIVAETIVEGDFSGAGSKSFNRLFKYISGSNNSRQKISMTSPVSQAAESEKISMTSPVGQQKEADGRWAVSFMMPASFTMATLPEPKDPLVILKQVPERYIATVRYSGRWSEERYLYFKGKLDAWIKVNNLIVEGEPTWARYDPPFKPWFMRRNEVLVPIVKPKLK